MSYVRIISYGMTIVGIALAAVSILLDGPPALLLTGLLLVVAGAVKIAIFKIWETMFALPPIGFLSGDTTESASGRGSPAPKREV